MQIVLIIKGSIRDLISMGNKWKCLTCGEEVDDNEPCKCMKKHMGYGNKYGHKGSPGYIKSKNALKELKRYSP